MELSISNSNLNCSDSIKKNNFVLTSPFWEDGNIKNKSHNRFSNLSKTTNFTNMTSLSSFCGKKNFSLNVNFKLRNFEFENTLKDKKKIIFYKEIYKKLRNEKDESKFHSINLRDENDFKMDLMSEKIKVQSKTLKKLKIPKINLSKSQSPITKYKSAMGMISTTRATDLNSQLLTTRRNSNHSSLKEEDFKNTIDYIQNFSIASKSQNKIQKPIKFLYEDYKKYENEYNKTNLTQISSQSKSQQHKKKNHLKNLNQTIKMTQNNFSNSKTKFMRKNYPKEIFSTIQSFKNKNESITVNNIEKKIQVKFDFNQIQDKMQKTVHSQLRNKGEYYVPNLNSLIKFNHYLIRDFKIGARSKLNLK